MRNLYQQKPLTGAIKVLGCLNLFLAKDFDLYIAKMTFLVLNQNIISYTAFREIDPCQLASVKGFF